MLKSPILTGLIVTLTDYFLIFPACLFLHIINLNFIMLLIFISTNVILYSLLYRDLMTFKDIIKCALTIFAPSVIFLSLVISIFVYESNYLSYHNSHGGYNDGYVLVILGIAFLGIIVLFGVAGLNCLALFVSNIISYYLIKSKEKSNQITPYLISDDLEKTENI